MLYVINTYISATVGLPIVIRTHLGPGKNPRIALHAREHDLGRDGVHEEGQHETRMTIGLTILTREGSLTYFDVQITTTLTYLQPTFLARCGARCLRRQSAA